MKSAETRALTLTGKLARKPSHEHYDIIMLALKEQDKITRHACAEVANESIFIEYHSREIVHQAIMDVKTK